MWLLPHEDQLCKPDSKSKRFLRWFVEGPHNILFVDLRRLLSLRLDIIFDLKLVQGN